MLENIVATVEKMNEPMKIQLDVNHHDIDIKLTGSEGMIGTLLITKSGSIGFMPPNSKKRPGTDDLVPVNKLPNVIAFLVEQRAAAAKLL